MTIFPGGIATNSDLYVAVDMKSTLLTDNPLSNSATTVNVTSTTGFPSVGYISIDAEIIKYTGTTATSFTGCTRGALSTTAVSHALNAQVDHNVVSDHHNVLKDEIIAIETSLDLTANRAIISNGSGRLAVSTVTSTELGHVSGVTSAIQTQLNAKATDSLVVHLAGAETITGQKTFSEPIIQNDTSNQLVLGVTNTTTVSATAPSTSRVVTIPDPGANASFVMTEGTQTINGTKTISALTGTLAANLAAGGFKLTGLAAGSANGDSVRFEQLKYIQAPVVATTTTQTTTTSTSFVSSSLTANITPSSASNRIKITAMLYVEATAGGTDFLTIQRDSTDLGGSDGIARVAGTGTQEIDSMVTLSWIDSPATTSAVTYTVRGKTGGANTLRFGGSTNVQVSIILEEVV